MRQARRAGLPRQVPDSHSRRRAATFRLEVHRLGDRVCLAPIGELDLATARQFDDGIRELDQTGADRLVIDLRGLSFVDVPGLRSVVTAQLWGRQSARRVEVIHPSRQAERLMALTGMVAA